MNFSRGHFKDFKIYAIHASFHSIYFLYKILMELYENKLTKGAKGDWDFRISDLVKNPNGTDI